MDKRFYCTNDKILILLDRIFATSILCVFFLVGTMSNLSFICIYNFKHRKRYFFHGLKKSTVRFKNNVNNKAVYTLSMSNLTLSFVFIPYTIVFRVWNKDTHLALFKVMEHFKDTFIYINLLITIILSIERYVAVCKPHHYKRLEININKIIWLLVLVAVLFSATNYFTDVKSDMNCDYLNRTLTSDDLNYNRFVYTFNEKKRIVNMNLLTSAFLFSVSGIVSTIFYIQIARNQIVKHMNENLKQQQLTQPRLSTLPKVSTKFTVMDNPSISFLNSTSSPAKVGTSKCAMDRVRDEAPDNIDAEIKPNNKTANVKNELRIHDIVVVFNNCDQSDEQKTTENKSSVSVQTDFAIDHKKLLKKRSSTMLSARIITKTSIWVNV